MPQFNIYRIEKSKEAKLKRKLSNIGLQIESSLTINHFQIDFFLHFDKNPMWWIEYYYNWISQKRKDEEAAKKENFENKNYFGAIIISNKKICYAISLGKTHFYIKKYCEYDFGIRFAQRIIDKNNVTLINANAFGGNKRKSINTFASNSSLTPESGEAIMNIKGGATNNEKFGKFVTCGDSVNISLEEYEPNQLPELIEFIEKCLKNDILFSIPTSRKIVDESTILKLDSELADKIINSSTEVGFSELVSSDNIGFLFRGDFYVKHLICNRYKINIDDDLSFASIRKNFEDKGVEFIKENLMATKIKVQTSTGHEISKPLKYFLDYVNETNCYLNEGKWHQFNQKYLDFLDESISLVQVEFLTEFNNSRDLHKKWVKDNGHDIKKEYFEKYFNDNIMTSKGFINYDRNCTLSPDDDFRRYRLEIADSIKDDTLAFVKKGTLQKLNYVIDQSLTTFKYLQENNFQIEIGSEVKKIRKMCLVLLFERLPFASLNEIDSLIFKIKINEWRKKLLSSNIVPVVWCSFLNHEKNDDKK